MVEVSRCAARRQRREQNRPSLRMGVKSEPQVAQAIGGSEPLLEFPSVVLHAHEQVLDMDLLGASNAAEHTAHVR